MSNLNQSLPLPQNDDQQSSPALASQSDPALNIIRGKIDHLYDKEPDAKQEAREIANIGAYSKHQKYMHGLQQGGLSSAQIQAAWHAYYQNLPTNEKHQVWHEFYQNQTRQTPQHIITKPSASPQPKATTPQNQEHQPTHVSPANSQTGESIKQKITNTVSARGKLKSRHHLQSILFGVGMGLAILMIFMFSFFNQKFIAPFISPSKTASSSPIIIDPSSANKVGPEPIVIIPKINVDVPVVYDIISNAEKDIQNALNNGVAHYPKSALPGQKGNVAIVGHSSNNLFNPGKYKFAFVLLNRMQPGDTFFLNYNGQRYVYRVYKTQVVKPSDTWVLNPQPGKESVATLITCDPPGTNVNRLVVVGEQISPEPASNVAATPSTNPNLRETVAVPGNSPSLFDRIFGRR